jgi:hypothetical protein
LTLHPDAIAKAITREQSNDTGDDTGKQIVSKLFFLVYLFNVSITLA